VVEEAVDRRRPGAGERREPLGPVGAQTAGWARTVAPALVPLLQRLRARVQRRDEPLGIDQVVVLAAVGGAVEVLAAQLQPQVAREHPRAFARPGRVARLP